MPISIRARLFGVLSSQESVFYYRQFPKSKLDHVDMCFAEQGNPIVLGVRIVGNDTDNRIEAACIGVLNYADESKRTVDSLLNYS